MFGVTLIPHRLIGKDVMSALLPSREPNDEPLGVLADVTRRRIVRLVHGRPEAVSEQELAERLAAADAETDASDAASDPARSYRIRLRHVHLPKLAEGALVEWDEDARTVEATNQPVDDGPRAEKPIPPGDRTPTASPPTADRRRTVLDVVESETGSVTREALARELASREADGRPTEARIEEVTVRLHHHDLPKLCEAGLVEYDRDDGTVECNRSDE